MKPLAAFAAFLITSASIWLVVASTTTAATTLTTVTNTDTETGAPVEARRVRTLTIYDMFMLFSTDHSDLSAIEFEAELARVDGDDWGTSDIYRCSASRYDEHGKFPRYPATVRLLSLNVYSVASLLYFIISFSSPKVSLIFSLTD